MTRAEGGRNTVGMTICSSSFDGLVVSPWLSNDVYLMVSDR